MTAQLPQLRNQNAPADRPSLRDDRDTTARLAGPLAAACGRHRPRERFVRGTSGGNALESGQAVWLDVGWLDIVRLDLGWLDIVRLDIGWLDRSRLRRGRNRLGMPGPAGRQPMQGPPAGRCPGRGPAAASRGDCEHPHPRRRSLLPQAPPGPLHAGRRAGAGRPELLPNGRVRHITGARSGRYSLRFWYSLTHSGLLWLRLIIAAAPPADSVPAPFPLTW
jgi:hypothetical protein